MEFKKENTVDVIDVRKPVNGVRFSLIQCDDETYSVKMEVSGLRQLGEFLGRYAVASAFANIADNFMKAKEAPEESEEPEAPVEEEEAEGEG